MPRVLKIEIVSSKFKSNGAQIIKDPFKKNFKGNKKYGYFCNP